jgi:hypothetical protein
MPFDGRNVPLTDALIKLDAVAELLREEKRWCKGALINRRGQMCLLGAMYRTGSDALLSQCLVLAAQDLTGVPYARIESFNDAPDTTHQAVLELLRRAHDGIETGRYAVRRKRSFDERCRSFVQRAYLRVAGLSC